MQERFINKNLLKIIIGTPIILLLLSIALIKNTPNAFFSETQANPYLKPLPSAYYEAYRGNELNDSTFFSGVRQSYATRELVVLKESPTDDQKRIDFAVELYPSNKIDLPEGQTHLVFNIKNNAAIYRHQGKTLGLFKVALPFIEIKKLVVKHKTWQNTIENPFQAVQESYEFKKENGVESKANPYNSVFISSLKQYDIGFLPYTYKVKENTIKQVNLSLKNFVEKEKVTIGEISQPSKFWDLVTKKDISLTNLIKFSGIKSTEAKKLLEGFVYEGQSIETVFNFGKLALFSVLKQLFANNCDEKLLLIYNPNENLLEPFYASSKCLGKMSRNIKQPKTDHTTYTEAYLKAIEKVSSLDIETELLQKSPSLEAELSFINRYEPTNILDVDIIYLNQQVLKKSIKPEAVIMVELLDYNNQKLTVTITNNSYFPIEISGLNHKKNKRIIDIDPVVQISSNSTDTITINLPRSFENLFVSKKSKQAGFVLYKDIYDLYVSYSLSYLNKDEIAQIYPFQQNVEIAEEEDLFRMKYPLENNDAVVINEQTKTISTSRKELKIASPLIIPSGYTFAVSPGTTIDIVNGGKIISHAPLSFKGTKQNPISIKSSDKKGQGVLVLSEGKESLLEYVNFDGLSNPKHGNWNVTGAVTFYESPVNLINVNISNNKCEDALNIVRTTFIMKNCNISNTLSDAFDGDFVHGTIKNSKFDHLGNDAIDVSGSDLIINNAQISNAGDKGISAGEDSKMTIKNVEISDSEIAVAGKDLSIIHATNLKIINTLAFTAFQKKAEFGPSNITVNKITMEGVEIQYLIENTSSMKVDGLKIETSPNVKDRMYGVEFGVSSEETRNSQ